MGCVSNRSKEDELIRALDHSNFDDTIRVDGFIFVVTFYKSECSHFDKLTPKLLEAAKLLTNHHNSPTIVFAKVNADPHEYIHLANLHIGDRYGVWNYPAIKIFSSAGKNFREYHGPRDPKDIAGCLKRLIALFLPQINSLKDAHLLIGQHNTVIVGIFPAFCGVEYHNFKKVAEILHWDYDIYCTLDINHIPNSESSGPLVRVFKPLSRNYDGRYADTTNFNVNVLLSFIKEAIKPAITLFNHDPRLDAAFFSSKMRNDKAMLFVDRCCHGDYETTYCELAKNKKADKISFMLGYFGDSRDALEYFNLHESRVPLIVIRNPKGQTYVNADFKNADDIATWLEDYMAGKVEEYGIPSRKKNEPKSVMVVVPDTFEKMVMDSGKNVFLWLGPWCHWCDSCTKVVKVLDDVSVRLEKEKNCDVLLAKLYKDAHRIRRQHLYEFTEDRPILCLKRAGEKKLYLYHGEVTTDKIVVFINKNAATDHVKEKRAGKKVCLNGENKRPIKKGMRACGFTFREMVTDTTRSNYLLVFYGSNWHNEYTVLLENMVDYFGKEKDYEVAVALVNYKEVSSYYCTASKALVEVMHHFRTLNYDDELPFTSKRLVVR